MTSRVMGRFLFLIVVGMSSKAAFAESICVSYWPWGKCAIWETTSTLSGSGGSSGRDYDRISFKNECSRKIQTAIRVKSLSGNWQTNGWWTLAPGETAYVADTRNSIFYVHGQTLDPLVNRLKWGGTDFHDRIRNSGNVEGFRRVRSNPNVFVNYTYKFTCDGIYRYKAISLAWNSNGAWASRVRNTLAEANSAALNACQNCTLSGITVNPRSPGCIAVVKVPNTTRLYGNRGNNSDEARNAALLRCGRDHAGCTVEHLICND